MPIIANYTGLLVTAISRSPFLNVVLPGVLGHVPGTPAEARGAGDPLHIAHPLDMGSVSLGSGCPFFDACFEESSISCCENKSHRSQGAQNYKQVTAISACPTACGYGLPGKLASMCYLPAVQRTFACLLLACLLACLLLFVLACSCVGLLACSLLSACIFLCLCVFVCCLFAHSIVRSFAPSLARSSFLQWLNLSLRV